MARTPFGPPTSDFGAAARRSASQVPHKRFDGECHVPVDNRLMACVKLQARSSASRKLALLSARQPIAALMREKAGSFSSSRATALASCRTAVGPDIVLIDPRLSRGLLGLPRAHPFSRHAQISKCRATGDRDLNRA